MSKLSPARWLTIITVAFVFSSCSTIESRIKEKKELYARLSPEMRQGIQKGRVAPGFLPEMVYMALGQPNQVITSADGRETVWSYLNFNTPEGNFMIQPMNITHNPVDSKSLLFKNNSTNDSSWHDVTGKADLDRGDLTMPDNSIRPKTAQEMTMDIDRQDLLIRFIDGKAIEFRLVRI